MRIPQPPQTEQHIDSMTLKRIKQLSLLGICLAFTQFPGTLQAVNFETFDLGWSGPAFTPAGGYTADTGVAVGSITFDIDNPTLAGSVTAFNFTVTGSALPGYDGPHTLADYVAGPGSVTLTVGGPVIPCSVKNGSCPQPEIAFT